MRRKLFLETFGCQMNVLDSELVLSQLCAQGFELVEDHAAADVILYNTCSVREHAEQKVWSRLGELRDRKRENPSLVIGVIGCMAEREGTDLFTRNPHVDLLCGPAELDKLPRMVHNACLSSPESPRERQTALMGSGVRRSSTIAAAEDSLEMLDLSRRISPADDQTQAYVRITRGCNKFCTYCVVPFTRGPEVHRPPANIIEEIRRLVDAGVKEVTLLGQTINHYCYDHGGGKKTTFADLLYLAHESAPDLPRLRFVTSFPRDFSDEALQAMRDCSRICRYLHAPAQHGNDRILKLMNRGYAAQQYYDFAGRAKEMMPDVCIASDFIVGFPSETDAEFDQTADMVRRLRFKNSFIFKYSPRPGTAAINRYEDDVPEEVKRRRNNDLLAAQAEASIQNNRDMVGKRVEVIVEGESKLVSRQKAAKPSSPVELGWEKRASANTSTTIAVETQPQTTQLIGRTRGDQVVCFDGPISLKGQLVDLEITDAHNLTLFGRAMECR